MVGLVLALLAGPAQESRAQSSPGSAPPAAPTAAPAAAPPATASPTASASPAATASPTASASPAAKPAPSEDDRKAAARSFAGGEQLFAKGDFLRAATSFEEAHARAPHSASSWNAARSWHRAGELDRAANRYTHFLADAPSDAPDRDAALRALRELSPRLGRFEIQAAGLEDVRVDGEPARPPTVYVYPGSHLITARSGDRTITRTERVEAGLVASVVLGAAAAGRVEPGPTSSPAPSATVVALAPTSASLVSASPTPAPAPAPAPAATFAGLWPVRGATLAVGVITVAFAALTVASGVDTLDSRAAYDAAVAGGDAAGARSLFAEGVAKQQRTNGLAAGLIGAAALTGAGVVWLVVADAPRDAPGRPSGASLVVRGAF